MVFGLGKGKIKINLEKTDFFPGDIIRGNVTLELIEPIQGRPLKVAFIWQKYIEYGASTHSSHQTIHRDELLLDEENEYYGNIYPFEFKIPDDILYLAKHWIEGNYSGKLKEIMLKSQAQGLFKEDDRFFVKASLDIPRGMDLKDNVKINIMER